MRKFSCAQKKKKRPATSQKRPLCAIAQCFSHSGPVLLELDNNNNYPLGLERDPGTVRERVFIPGNGTILQDFANPEIFPGQMFHSRPGMGMGHSRPEFKHLILRLKKHLKSSQFH